MLTLCPSTFPLLSIRHGDLLYVGFAEVVPQAPSSKSQKIIVQDAVDDHLDTQNGLIKRDKDAKL